MYYEKKLENSVNGIFEGLVESEFLEENNITDVQLVKTIIRETITPKVIKGVEYNSLLNDTEFETLLKKIMLSSVMEKLKKTGIIGSYEDDDTCKYFIKNKV